MSETKVYSVMVTLDGRVKAEVVQDRSEYRGGSLNDITFHPSEIVKSDGSVDVVSHARIGATSTRSLEHAEEMAVKFAEQNSPLLYRVKAQLRDWNTRQLIDVVTYQEMGLGHLDHPDNTSESRGFEAFFVVGRDQKIRSRHLTEESARASASDRPLEPETFEDLEGWTRPYEIKHKGLVPLLREKVPLAWIRACTSACDSSDGGILIDDLWAFEGDAEDYERSKRRFEDVD